LIRSALIKQSSDQNVYISAQKSITMQFYVHSIVKRAKSIALLDLGAMENFMNLPYTKWLCLSIKQLENPRPMYSINGTENKSGRLKYYMDLKVQNRDNK
jgi:hypothetical protein